MKIVRYISIFLILALFLIVSSSTVNTVNATPDSWEWQGPVSGDIELYDVWGVSSDDVYAVGKSGIILHYDGIEWSAMESGTTEDIWGVWASSSDNVDAVTFNGNVLHYDGNSWTSSSSGASYLYGIWGTGPTNIYATGYMTVRHYDGSSWAAMTGLPGGLGTLLDVWASSSSDVFVVGDSGNIIHYDGSGWTEMDSGYSGLNDYIWGVWGTGSDDVYAAGSMGVLSYNGTEWSLMSGSTGNYIDIWGTSDSDIFAVGRDGRVDHFDGSDWTQMYSRTGAAHYINGIWGTASNDVIAVGQHGMITHYDGNNWLAMCGGASAEFLLGVWGSSSNDIYAVGSYNNVLHYDGTRWTAIDTGTTNRQLNAVWGSGSDDVFVVGLDGLILHYDGTDWTQMDSGVSGTSGDLFAVWGTSSTDVHAVGSEGTMLHYDGTEWQNIAPGGGAIIRGLWGSSDNNVYAVGAAARIYSYNGTEWKQVITGLGTHFSAVWGSSASDVFVVGDGGMIIHYDGVNWAYMTSNTTSNLYGIWGSSATDVYAVGESGLYAGNIYHYDGTSWTQVDTGLGDLGNNSYRDIWGILRDDMYVVGSLGAIVHSIPPPPPTADFYGTPTSGDAPLTVNFTDNSTGADRTAWFWDFGDSSNSTAQNPSHTYYSPGTYTVSLKVWDGEDTEVKTDYITVSKSASSVWVDDDWSGLNPGDSAGGHTYGYDAFADIQDAIDAVVGSTINVAAGQYGSFQVSGMSNLNIVGSNGANVSGITGVVAARIENSTNVNINNIDFNDNDTNCIYYANSTGIIQNVDITAPDGGSGYECIRIHGGVPTTVTISNTHITGYFRGIVVWNDTVNINGCTIEGPGTSGIYIGQGADITVRETKICGLNFGIMVGEGITGILQYKGETPFSELPISPSQAEISSSEIYNNINGIYVYFNGTINALNNNIHDNEHGIYLNNSSNNVIKGNDITSNHAYEDSGIHLFGGSGNIINWNNITGNTPYGIYHQLIVNGIPTEEMVNAENNWWGSSSGPGGSGPGTGDAVNEYVDYTPWLTMTNGSTSTATGTGTATVTSSSGILENLQNIAEEDLTSACAVGKPDVDFPHGLFSFNITGLTAGATVTVEFTLPAAVPQGVAYWKCQGGSWVQLPVGDDDGDNVITITLTDGGTGDADGIANGTIQDPGGPTVPATPTSTRQEAYGDDSEARFTYQNMVVSPASTYPGRPVEISAYVVNSGNARGSATVYLTINGNLEQSRTVSVNPGTFEKVIFTVNKSQPGVYQFSVNQMYGSFQVIGVSGISSVEPQSPEISETIITIKPPPSTDTGFGTEGIIAVSVIGIILIAGIIVAIRFTRPA